MKYLLAFLAFLVLVFLPAKQSLAFYDPVTTPNNNFGIHIADPANIEEAAKLVNSSGGDWGYVTFVITKGNRNKAWWQSVLDRCRRAHLIPIVRVATQSDGDKWQKPSFGEIDGWVDFFSSLNWVVKNHYVIIANEPNHAKEWGGEINPEEYSDYLKEFSQKLKSRSSDYFILNAGFDASAANTNDTMDERNYIKRMIQKNPDIFNYIDGWNSHSYPNPDFSGSELSSGKGTIKTYLWEEQYLRSLGIDKKLPIFITETGWAHQLDGSKNNLLSPDDISKKIVYAMNNVWNDPNIIAVTPFILNYSEPPFDIFSWVTKDGQHYDFFDVYKNQPKNQGKPLQEIKGNILSYLSFPIKTIDSEFSGILLLQNNGQSIFDNSNISLKGVQNIDISSFFSSQIEPGRTGIITFKAALPKQTGIFLSSVQVFSNNVFVDDISFQTIVIKPIKVRIFNIFDKIGSSLGL